MATKAQIARKMYGCSLSELSGGEKAAVTKAFNKQDGEVATPRATRTRASSNTGADVAVVKFARPGVNGTKESVVNAGTTVGDALSQAGITINNSKEGILTKAGNAVKFDDVAKDGTLYLIVPGVDSSC